MIKVHFLGTNGWYPSRTGHTTCHLIDAPEAYIILDAGTGIYKVDKFITEDKPIYLFMSHLHFDHVFGLHILNRFSFKQGLKVVTHRQNYKDLLHIFGQPYTVSPEDLPYDVTVSSIAEGESQLFPFELTCLKQVHISPCYGYRFGFKEGTIAYCTDTGKCNAVKELAKDADLLIAECALLPGETNRKWPHMNPTDSANCALEANCKKLAVIHYDAEKYPSMDIREKGFAETLKVFPNSFMAIDDSELTL